MIFKKVRTHYLLITSIFTILYCYPFQTLGQESIYLLKSYTSKNGLPTNLTKDAIKDAYGFIWLATDEGLVRFDGLDAEVFEGQLPSPYIKSLYLTKSNKLYAVHDKGLSEIISTPDSVSFSTTLLTEGDAVAEKMRYPKSVFEDKQGRLWLAGYAHIGYQDRQGTWNTYEFEEQYHSNSFTVSYSMTEDGNGNLWLSSFRGYLFRFNEIQEKFELVDYPEGIEKPNEIHTIKAVGKDKVFLGTSDGAILLQTSSDGHIESGRKIKEVYYTVSEIQYDQKNTVFFSTYGLGIWQMNLNTNQVTQIKNTLDPNVLSIYLDKENTLWHCTDQGLGMLKSSYFNQVDHLGRSEFVQAVTTGDQDRIFTAQSGVYEVISKEKSYDLKLLMRAKEAEMAVKAVSDGLWVGDAGGRVYFYNFSTGSSQEIKSAFGGTLISSLETDLEGNIWISYDYKGGLKKLSSQNKVTDYQDIAQDIFPVVIKRSMDNQIYIGGKGATHFLSKYDDTKGEFINLSQELPLQNPISFEVKDIEHGTDGSVWLGTTEGLWKYQGNKFEQIDLGMQYDNHTTVFSIEFGASGDLWFATKYGLLRILPNQDIYSYTEESGLPSNTFSYRSLVMDNHQKIWIGTSKSLAYSYTPIIAYKTPKPLFKNVEINGERVHLVQNKLRTIDYDNYIKVDYSSIVFPSNGVLYQYKVSKNNDQDASWSIPTKKREALIPPQESGQYTLSVRALAPDGYSWSKPTVIYFDVEGPWFFRWWAIVFFLVLSASVIYGFVRINSWRLIQEKVKLEAIVTERTAEVTKKNEELQARENEILTQNEELHQQSEEIMAQRDYIEKKNAELALNNEKITDSLRYAQHIQSCILPTADEMAQCFEDYFVLIKPKDIVSGDFYWMVEYKEKVFFAVADCTGHGVPGAFMSMVGHTLLNEIVRLRDITEPAEVLYELHWGIRKELRQDENNNQDGMDIGLCVFHRKEDNTIDVDFSGAKMPFFYINEHKELIRTSGVNKSLGGSRRSRKNRNFEAIRINVPKGTTFYLATDGYRDQCNDHKKRIGLEKFMELIEVNSSKDFNEQKEILDQYLKEFQNTAEQRDDITVVGLKLKS